MRGKVGNVYQFTQTIMGQEERTFCAALSHAYCPVRLILPAVQLSFCNKRLNRRMSEQVGCEDIDIDSLEQINYSHRQQRVAPQLKEVVVSTHSFDLEHLRP